VAQKNWDAEAAAPLIIAPRPRGAMPAVEEEGSASKKLFWLCEDHCVLAKSARGTLKVDWIFTFALAAYNLGA